MVNSYINSQYFNENQIEKLSAVLSNFYLLTGIKICVFNPDGEEIASAPETDGAFCRYVHESKAGECECTLSRKEAFLETKKSLKPMLYHCRMGLAECVAPIVQFDKVLGYVMIGQISDESFILNDEKKDYLKREFSRYGLNFDKAIELLSSVDKVNSEKLGAAVSILETCASHIFLNKLLTIQSEFANGFDEYVKKNIEREITVENLCKALKITLMELYHLSSVYFHDTPAKRVKELRLNYACQLLEEGELSIGEIAYKTGFCDYNYFSKVFKKEKGISPTQYKKLKK